MSREAALAAACGLCEDLPCETFASLRDPSLSDEQFERSVRERQESLTLRREIGTEAWLRRRGSGGR